MEQTIGDAMKEIIIDQIPPPTTPPPPKTERMMKKIMRSAYIPDEVDLIDEKACIECLAKDPILLRDLLNSIKYKNTPEMKKSYMKKCMAPGESRKIDCLKKEAAVGIETVIKEDKRCRWRKDIVCPCKQMIQDVCNKCRCECAKSCLKCTCDKPKTPRPNIQKEEQLETETTVEKEEEKPKKRTSKRPSELEEAPLTSSPTVKKTGRKGSKKKLPKKSKWKRPNNIICERFEFVEPNPYCQESEEVNDVEPVQIYEHFRSVKGVRSGSSKSTSEAPENYTAHSSTTQKNSISIHVSGSTRTKKGRSKQNKPIKLPWNWHNQPQKSDLWKGWGGTKYSWSKKLDYAKLDRKLEEDTKKINRKLEEDTRKMDRSRGGDDDLCRYEENEPKFFQYKPNLRPNICNQVTATENEEEIKEKEKRRYKNGYGMMRVKSWHQTFQKNDPNSDEENDEDQTESPKDKSEFSEEDDQETYEDDHDRKQCLQCLMSDVQQKFLGSSNNLCGHKMDKNDRNLEPLKYNMEDVENSECLSARKLSTIIEENHCKSDGSEEMGTHRVNKEEDINTQKRPKTAEAYFQDSSDKPFFNVIKQRIHSRKKTLETLDQFRNDLYKKPETEHTCVHRFTIDERLFPKPLHCDESGTSCCVHCDKPMTSSEKSVFLDQRESKEKIGCVQKQASKLSLRPKPVHIGAKNSVMEIRLRPEHDDLLKGYGVGKKRMFYPDSLALRHQKR